MCDSIHVDVFLNCHVMGLRRFFQIGKILFVCLDDSLKSFELITWLLNRPCDEKFMWILIWVTAELIFIGPCIKFYGSIKEICLLFGKHHKFDNAIPAFKITNEHPLLLSCFQKGHLLHYILLYPIGGFLLSTAYWCTKKL